MNLLNSTIFNFLFRYDLSVKGKCLKNKWTFFHSLLLSLLAIEILFNFLSLVFAYVVHHKAAGTFCQEGWKGAESTTWQNKEGITTKERWRSKNLCRECHPKEKRVSQLPSPCITSWCSGIKSSNCNANETGILLFYFNPKRKTNEDKIHIFLRIPVIFGSMLITIDLHFVTHSLEFSPSWAVKTFL